MSEVTWEVTWEVWRSHARGGPDVWVYRGMSEPAAATVLDECREDPQLHDFCTFYLVKATTTRERVGA